MGSELCSTVLVLWQITVDRGCYLLLHVFIAKTATFYMSVLWQVAVRRGCYLLLRLLQVLTACLYWGRLQSGEVAICCCGC